MDTITIMHKCHEVVAAGTSLVSETQSHRLRVSVTFTAELRVAPPHIPQSSARWPAAYARRLLPFAVDDIAAPDAPYYDTAPNFASPSQLRILATSDVMSHSDCALASRSPAIISGRGGVAERERGARGKANTPVREPTHIDVSLYAVHACKPDLLNIRRPSGMRRAAPLDASTSCPSTTSLAPPPSIVCIVVLSSYGSGWSCAHPRVGDAAGVRQDGERAVKKTSVWKREGVKGAWGSRRVLGLGSMVDGGRMRRARLSCASSPRRQLLVPSPALRNAALGDFACVRLDVLRPTRAAFVTLRARGATSSSPYRKIGFFSLVGAVRGERAGAAGGPLQEVEAGGAGQVRCLAFALRHAMGTLRSAGGEERGMEEAEDVWSGVIGRKADGTAGGAVRGGSGGGRCTYPYSLRTDYLCGAASSTWTTSRSIERILFSSPFRHRNFPCPPSCYSAPVHTTSLLHIPVCPCDCKHQQPPPLHVLSFSLPFMSPCALPARPRHSRSAALPFLKAPYPASLARQLAYLAASAVVVMVSE
ncbi:hypothetical protein C8R45DRAFT_927625 [Mycena sanguinolenta]|nr:hypothetical protein C8R45DRAFT_927625 [Mycena sanguinolenta]